MLHDTYSVVDVYGGLTLKRESEIENMKLEFFENSALLFIVQGDSWNCNEIICYMINDIEIWKIQFSSFEVQTYVFWIYYNC